MDHHLSHYVWAFVLAAIVAGLLWPSPGLWLRPYLGIILICLMTLSCLRIGVREIKIAFLHKDIYLIVALTLATPLLVLLARPFLAPDVFGGLIIATAVPAGVSIVFICDMCHGSSAEALSITTLSHLLSIFTIPVFVRVVLGKVFAISWLSTFLLMLKFIALPLVIAQFLGPLKRFPRFVWAASTVLLIAIIWAIVAPARRYLVMHTMSAVIVFAITIACIIVLFVIGWVLGRNLKEKITYSMSASYKNFTLSNVLAIQLFGEGAALAAIAYAILNSVLFAAIDWFVVRHER